MQFPSQTTFDYPTSPQYFKYFSQYLTRLVDGKTQRQRFEAVVLHEYTFCMSLPNILSKAILPMKVSSLCTYSCITSTHIKTVHHSRISILIKYKILTKMIKCHFHNCHFQNSVCCGNDMESSNNIVLSFFVRSLLYGTQSRMVRSIYVFVHCPRPMIYIVI